MALDLAAIRIRLVRCLAWAPTQDWSRQPTEDLDLLIAEIERLTALAKAAAASRFAVALRMVQYEHGPSRRVTRDALVLRIVTAADSRTAFALAERAMQTNWATWEIEDFSIEAL